MSPRRLDAAIATALGAFTAVLLLATRAQQLSGDSLAYAVAIRSGTGLFHPHHLLFSPIVRALYLPLAALHDGFDAILVAQLHNVAWAVVAVVSVYAIVAKMQGSRPLAAAAALGLLACRGFAVFATEVEVYVPAAGCAALLLLSLLRGAGAGRIGLLLALLVFYHQSNVLFSLPLLVFLAWNGERPRIRAGLRAVALAGTLALAGYVMAYLSAGGSPGFVEYTLRYAVVEGFSPKWGTAEHVGGGGVAALFDSQAWNLVQTQPAGAARAAVRIFLTALVAYSVWRIARRPRDEAYRAALVLWLLVYGAFFLWWLPDEHEFFVVTLVPIVLLVAKALGTQGKGLVAAGLLFASVAVLLPRQVLGSLLPAHRTRGAAYEIAREYAAAAPDCIQLNGRQVIQALRYYFDLEPEATVNIKLARRCFVRTDAESTVEPLPAARCVAVPLSEALPPGGRTGRVYDDPLGWLGYYRWLFRLEIHEGRLRAPAVTVRRLPSGPPLLEQEGPPVEFRDLADFFDSFGRGERLDEFGAWLEANRAALRGRVDPVWLGADNESPE